MKLYYCDGWRIKLQDKETIQRGNLVMNKILTVSIAAYNVEKYINETLSSCIIDKYMDELEVLIINDGSADKTVDIAQKYVQRYPNTFRIISKENGGYGTTVNTGIKEATGKYFKLLDGDDWFNQTALCEFIEILRQEECDLIITDFVEKYESGRIRQRRIDVAYGKAYSLKNQMFFLPMHAVCYKTYILKNNSIKLHRRILYTDTEFALYPLFYVKSFSHYPVFLYKYRLGRDGQSVSVKSYCMHISDMCKVINNKIAYYKEHNINNGADMIIPYNIAMSYNVNLSTFLRRKISRKTKYEMMEREEKVKQECPIVYYMAVNDAIILQLLRKSNYKLYYALGVYVRIKRWICES